jgi:hypothetical protein
VGDVSGLGGFLLRAENVNPGRFQGIGVTSISEILAVRQVLIKIFVRLFSAGPRGIFGDRPGPHFFVTIPLLCLPPTLVAN